MTPGESSAVSIHYSPIVLGITGHLDVSEEQFEPLKRALEEILRYLQKQYPHSPMIMLSLLARGSDQLAAQVALACNNKKDSRAGKVKVVAALPFPRDAYKRSSTFAGYDSAAEKLDELLDSQGVESFVVLAPGQPAENDVAAWQAILSDKEQRQMRYATAGGYIIRNCHALAAFWDGKPMEKNRPSGTAEIVECKLEGRQPSLSLLHQPSLSGAEKGPVFVIHTDRNEEPTESLLAPFEEKPGNVKILLPNAPKALPRQAMKRRPNRFRHRIEDALEQRSLFCDEANTGSVEWEQFQELCESVDDFNRDLKRNQKLVERRLQLVTKVWPWNEADGVTLPKAIRNLILLREGAAELAARLDRPAIFWIGSLFLVLFFAGLSFQFYAHWPFGPEDRLTAVSITQFQFIRNWLLLSFLSLLFVAGTIVVQFWYRRIAERRLDYRALSEALRVRIFWAVAGIGESVADSYLSQVRSEMAWARRALQVDSPQPQVWQTWFQSQPPEVQKERLQRVTGEWVQKQTQWFIDKLTTHHSGAARLRRGGFWVATVGWLLAAAMFLWFTWPSEVVPKTSINKESVSAPSPHLDAAEAPTGNSGAPARNSMDLSQNPLPYRFSWFDLVSQGEWLLIECSAMILFGGLLIAYCERRSHEELSKQYERTAKIFSQGEKEIKRHLENHDLTKVQDVLTALGREAIMENAQWLILRRSRPFELLIQ